MTDFIERTREDQAKLAMVIASALHKNLAEKFDSELERATQAASPQGTLLDPTLAREMLHDELERDVFVALIGLADWLGSRLFRAYPDADNHPREVLVTLGKQELPSIAEKYHLDLATLTLVLRYLLKTGAELAPVGTVVNGHLQPNWDSLKTWASHYEWS